jgi:hypothetical protein
MEMSAIIDSDLPRNIEDVEPMAVPDSMENNAQRMDLEDTSTEMHQQPRPHSRPEILAEKIQREQLFHQTTLQHTPTSRAKRFRSALSERNPNPSTLVRPTSKRLAHDQEDEPTTPAPGRKKIKASRAPVVNVGRSPTTSVVSFFGDGAEDMDEDDDL